MAITTQVYRKAVDAAWEALTADRSGGSSSGDAGRLVLQDSEWRDLQQVGRASGQPHAGGWKAVDCWGCRRQPYQKTNMPAARVLCRCRCLPGGRMGSMAG